MKLWDLLHVAQYFQVFSIYETNEYDENIPLARGKVIDLFDLKESEYNVFDHLMHEVEYINVTNDAVIVVFLRSEHYDESVATRYSEKYVAKWDTLKPDTRPWLHGCETEEFTDKYIYKFPEGSPDGKENET